VLGAVGEKFGCKSVNDNGDGRNLLSELQVGSGGGGLLLG
jgi:hypothetical protein